LILGAYSSPQAKKGSLEKKAEDKLYDLRSFLKEKGFSQTNLVKDWMDEEGIPKELYDIHFKEKSFFYIKNWADILVFIFFENCTNFSVIREWSYLIDSVPSKISQSVILRHENVNLGCLIRGDIRDNRVFEAKFSNDPSDLHACAFSGCISVLYRLLRKR